MNTITKQDIELSERLRLACANLLITNPQFVAQDANGWWYHYTVEPTMNAHRGRWLEDKRTGADNLFQTDENPNWRETLMEFTTPKIEAGKRYWRRDGHITDAISQYKPDVMRDGNILYNSNGLSVCGNGTPYDLIAEYREEEKPIYNKDGIHVATAYFFSGKDVAETFVNGIYPDDEKQPTETEL